MALNRSEALWWVGFGAVVAAVVYLIYPVERRVRGVGLVRPRFENAVLLGPRTGTVKRAVVQRLERVRAGDPVFTLVGEPWRVQMSQRVVWDAEAVAEQAARTATRETLSARRLARMRAGNEWCSAQYRAGLEEWESRLCNLWVHRIGAESERARLDAQPVDVAIYQPVEGAPAEIPYPSPNDGTVVTLWATPAMLISPDQPVAELLPDGAPLEVLGVVPASTRTRLGEGALRGFLKAAEAPLASQKVAVAGVQLGRAVLAPEQVALLFPSVTVQEPSVVARLLLRAEIDPADVDRVVPFDVAGPTRARILSWFSGRR